MTLIHPLNSEYATMNGARHRRPGSFLLRYVRYSTGSPLISIRYVISAPWRNRPATEQ